ncbi:MAG TPA: hypothetical protein VFU02_20165 [Polyangiaceae bacterium]|nr:hypothetical protein [Polyangiaceae bacterium]
MEVGDVFSVPLRAGKFGAAVVVDTSGGHTFLVIDGFWNTRPTADELREVREMPSPFGQPPLPGRAHVFKGWFDGEVPPDFEVVLRRPLTPQQESMSGAEGTMVFQCARDFARILSDQWRWLHDHVAYMKELEGHGARVARANEQRRANLSLESMLNETFFTSWAGRWPEDCLEEARRIFTAATARLIQLRDGGTPRSRAEALRKIVDHFNRLYNRTGLVESVERDSIITRIEELASCVGLDNAEEKLTRRRTW